MHNSENRRRFDLKIKKVAAKQSRLLALSSQELDYRPTILKNL